MATKFTVHAELTASDLASPVIKRARDTYGDFGDEISKTLRDAGIRVRDFGDETKKLEAAAANLKTLLAQGKLSADQYGNAMAQVTARQKKLAQEMKASEAPLKRTTGLFSSLTDVLSSRFVVTAGDVTRLISAIGRGLLSLVRSGSEAERNQRLLATALDATGTATQGNIDALNAQAQAIARVSDATDDQITSAQTLLANLNVQTDQIALAIEAARGLSAALGIDLASAAQIVGKTVNGSTREIARIVPEIKALSAESLKAGDGIALIEERFRGAAEAAAGNLSAQLKGLANDFGELGEAVASGISGSGDAAEGLQKIREAVQGGAQPAKEFGAGIAEIAKGVAALAAAVNEATKDTPEGRGFLDIIFSPVTNTVETIRLVGESALVVEQAGRAAADAAFNMQGLNERYAEAAQLAEQLNLPVQRILQLWQSSARAASEHASAVDEANAVLRSLGLSLPATQKQIEEQEAALRKLEEAYRLTGKNEYLEAQEKIREKLAEMRGETLATVDAVDRLATSHGAATGQVLSFTRALTSQATAARASAAALRESAAAAGEVANGLFGANGPEKTTPFTFQGGGVFTVPTRGRRADQVA